VIALTTYADDASVLGALRAGAPSYLTKDAAEVPGLIAGSLSNQEIAARLVVSPATVKSRVNHLFAKIDASDRAQAVGYAYRHGLVAGRLVSFSTASSQYLVSLAENRVAGGRDRGYERRKKGAGHAGGRGQNRAGSAGF
jgi:DNA-binding CsgD family transcriptional regulator